jgi:two-component system cell cycle response regulator DivK
VKWPRVIIIDDHPETIEFVTFLLTKKLISVVIARSIAQGLELALADIPDLIVCDLRFNGQEGYEFGRLAALEPRLKGVPMVILTDKIVEPEDQKKALEAGFLECVRKPMDPRQLAELLLAFLKKGIWRKPP